MNHHSRHSINHRLDIVDGLHRVFVLALDPATTTKQVQALIEELTTWRYHLDTVRRWRKSYKVPAPHGGARPQKKKIKNLTTK